MMEWSFVFHDEPRYVEVISRGVADEAGSLAMATAIQQTMKRAHLTRVLIDHRGLTAVTGTISALYDRPRLFRLIGVLLGIRIAELIQPQHREHFRFLETVCANRGFKLGIFYQHDEALAWLLH